MIFVPMEYLANKYEDYIPLPAQDRRQLRQEGIARPASGKNVCGADYLNEFMVPMANPLRNIKFGAPYSNQIRPLHNPGF